MQQVLQFSYAPCTITFHESGRAYIVEYRGRRIAFSERGGHIATGTPLAEDPYDDLADREGYKREQYRVSLDIMERALLVARLLSATDPLFSRGR